MLEVITQRKTEEARFIARVSEWSTKNISSMFIGLAEDKKQARAMNKMVEKMRFPLADEVNELVDDRPIEEVIEQGALVNLDNQPSFEAIAGALERL